jgi:hypothetical protein
MQGFLPEGIERLLRAYVQTRGAGAIYHQQEPPERIEENPDDPWWYGVVVPESTFPRGIFVKLKLVDPDEDYPCAEIVSCHPSSS